MATMTPFADTRTRPHWAGTDADLDIHIEQYEGEIEGAFQVESIFRSNGWSNEKSVEGKSNTWRGDRMGTVPIHGRKSGEAVQRDRMVNDKVLISVDTMLYGRTNLDYMDEWTAPSRRAEIVAEHASGHAKLFDEANMIQLIKCSDWKAPEALKQTKAFFDGYGEVLTGYQAADAKTRANKIVEAHKKMMTVFIKRRIGNVASNFRLLISPDWFSDLLEHDKLMNVDFQGGMNSNDFAGRRIARLNGCPVMEAPIFPEEATDAHPLGADFSVSEKMAKAGLIFFMPQKSLVTVKAQDMTVRVWDNEEDMENILDSYTMYNIGILRGDCCGTLFSD